MFSEANLTAISYSLIAPILLFPAVLGFSVIYTTYRYNLIFVYSSPHHGPSFVTPDTRGLLYPRALKQTLTGVYLAEICLVGLFGLRSAFGPVVMMFGLIIFTFLIHISLNDALLPLLYNLPRTLAAEEELRKAGNGPLNSENLADKNDNIEDAEPVDGAGYDSDFDPGATENGVSHGEQTSRGLSIPVEGADRALDLTTGTVKSHLRAKLDSSPFANFIQRLDIWTYWITPDPNTPNPNFILRFLHPEIFSDYHVLRERMIAETKDFPEVMYAESEAVKDAFHVEGVRRSKPRLWIPRDEAGVSRQEIDHTSKVVEITDEGAWIDARGVLVSDERTKDVGKWVLREEEKVMY